MLGLSGIGWMTISLTFAYVVHEIMHSLVVVYGGVAGLRAHRYSVTMFSIASTSMVVYIVIGIFLAPKWYLTLLFFLATLLISGRILNWLTALLIRKPERLYGFVYPLYASIQIVTAIFAYIAWF